MQLKIIQIFNSIGSGGNINKIFKMSGKPQDKPLTNVYLNQQLQKLNTMSYEQRISELGLNTASSRCNYSCNSDLFECTKNGVEQNRFLFLKLDYLME